MPVLQGAERWQRAAWVFLVACSALYFLSGNEADNDLWMHLLVGAKILAAHAVPHVDDLSYTAAGAPWVDHEWLTHVVLAGTFAVAGDRGIWSLKFAIGLATAWLLWRQVSSHTGVSWARGVAMLLSLTVLARGFAMRPQIVTYLGVAWLLTWLDGLGEGPREACATRGKHRWEWLGVAAVFLLWGNAHGGFVVGLGILALFAVGSSVPAARRRWGLLLAASLAVCLNPYGPALLAYLAREMWAAHPLTEWQPVALGDPAQRTFLVLVALLAATLPFARGLRARPWRTILLGGVVAMAFRHQRHTPLVALCAAGPLAEQLEGAAAWVRERGLVRLSTSATGVVAAGVAAIGILQVSMVARRMAVAGFRVVFAASDYPVGAVRFLERAGISGNLALPLDWGGYVLWHCSPKIRVSLDGRFVTVYPQSAIAATFDYFGGGPGGAAARLIDAYPTSLVLAPAGKSHSARRRSAWRVVYRDRVAELFARGEGTEPSVAPGVVPRGLMTFP